MYIHSFIFSLIKVYLGFFLPLALSVQEKNKCLYSCLIELSYIIKLTIIIQSLYFNNPSNSFMLKNYFYLLTWKREREAETEASICCSFHTLPGLLLHVPWLGIEPQTLAHWDDSPTIWATWPEPIVLCFVTF